MSADGRAVACKFVAPSGGGTISKILAYLGASADRSIQLGIYSHESENNRPDALLASSGDVAKGATAGWKIGNVSYAFTGGATYWLAVQTDSGTNTAIGYNDDASKKLDYKASQTELPASWGSTSSTYGRIPAICALYTPSGAASPVAKIIQAAMRSLA